MDHDATREQLELAAVEPGGLERLMAGDTVAAQAVAAHVAGLPGVRGRTRPSPARHPAHPGEPCASCRRPT